MEQIELTESTESMQLPEFNGMHHFDRMGRPLVVFDQRSNHNTSIMLEWGKHVENWQNNQVIIATH